MSVDISDRFVTDLMYENMQQLRRLTPISFDRKVEEQCGSIENYLTNVLEVDIDKLRKYYLE